MGKNSEKRTRKVSALEAHDCIKLGSMVVDVRVVSGKHSGLELAAQQELGYHTYYRCPACNKTLLKAIVGEKCKNSLCDAAIIAVRYRYEFEERARENA